MPPRVAALVPDRHAFLAAMPAFLPSSGALTTKLVSLFPENSDRPTHQAVIVCFDPVTGTPIALMDGGYITATRTGRRVGARYPVAGPPRLGSGLGDRERGPGRQPCPRPEPP